MAKLDQLIAAEEAAGKQAEADAAASTDANTKAAQSATVFATFDQRLNDAILAQPGAKVLDGSGNLWTGLAGGHAPHKETPPAASAIDVSDDLLIPPAPPTSPSAAGSSPGSGGSTAGSQAASTG